MIEQYQKLWNARLNGMQLCRIGITCAPDWRPQKELDTVLQTAEGVMQAGGLPVLLTTGYDLEGIHGLALTGGSDIDPTTYGQPPDGTKTAQLHPDYDRFEIECATLALHREMPIMTACRGTQILNIAAGGTLLQDNSDVSPEDHEDQRAPTQPLTVQPGTRFYDLVGPTALVNSIHHQSIDRLADVFLPAAHSEDGTIKAIQRKDLAWQWGFQFHPELMRRIDDRYQKFYERLIEDAVVFKKRYG